MYKMLMILDYDKMKRENIYSIESVKHFLSMEFAKRNIRLDDEGFYVGGTFEAYWSMILSLHKESWFMNNLKQWKWYNSDGAENEEYAIEDLLTFYNKNDLCKMVG